MEDDLDYERAMEHAEEDRSWDDEREPSEWMEI